MTNENAPEMVLGATLGKGNYGVVHRAEWRGRKDKGQRGAPRSKSGGPLKERRGVREARRETD